MNKFIASAGAIALSASAVNASPIESVDPGKAWTVGLSLRGFYDDNYVTATSGNERDSFGLDISPSVAYRIDPSDRTSLGLRYTFGATWYQDRQSLNSNNDSWDYSHALDGFLEHQFTQRLSLNVRDTFVIAQEPGLLNDLATPYRTEGNNLRNNGQISLTAVLTRELSLVLGYNNTYVDYEQSGGTVANPSLSGLLDRTEHEGLVNLRWQAAKESAILFGYNYKEVLHNSDEFIVIAGSPLAPQKADYRNNQSHIAYLGLDQNVSKDLVVTVRGGAEFVDYYNDTTGADDTSPYGQVAVNYTYRPNSTASLGWTYSHQATDVLSVDGSGGITQDQDASVLFAGINHYFDSRWQGKVNGFWQNSTYNGGGFDGESENFFGVALGLSYRFNRHLTGDVGYSFDTLTSDLPGRDYDRNRVFLGVTAVY